MIDVLNQNECNRIFNLTGKKVNVVMKDRTLRGWFLHSIAKSHGLFFDPSDHENEKFPWKNIFSVEEA